LSATSKERRPKPVIFGCSGAGLTLDERAVFNRADPFGFILFKRNCFSPYQVRSLIEELRQVVGRADVQIAIDQEGGRVSRLQPPHWTKYPPARTFGLIYERDPSWAMEAMRLYSRVVAHELSSLGITINCAPVADLYDPKASAAIGDRAYSSSPAVVSALARAQVDTFLANGIFPVVKHWPGHGRLLADPHKVLPVIDVPREELEALDFVAFKALKDVPLAMNSHAILSAFDSNNPASLSSVVNEDIIRGALGFMGLLLSDDLTMRALIDAPVKRVFRALEAGNDIALYCNGNLSEMDAIAQSLEPMSDKSHARWMRARDMLACSPGAFYDVNEDVERLDILLGGFAFEGAV